MVLGGIVGAVLAALIVGLGSRAPVAEGWATHVRTVSRAVPLPVWIGAPVALVILISLLLGAGGAGAASVLVVLLVSMVVLLALAGAWSWTRLRGLR